MIVALWVVSLLVLSCIGLAIKTRIWLQQVPAIALWQHNERMMLSGLAWLQAQPSALPVQTVTPKTANDVINNRQLIRVVFDGKDEIQFLSTNSGIYMVTRSMCSYPWQGLTVHKILATLSPSGTLVIQTVTPFY